MRRTLSRFLPVVLAALAFPATAAAEGFAGGIDWSPRAGDFRWCTRATVWHRGHTLYALTAYRYKLRVRWCHDWGGNIKDLSYRTYFTDEAGVVAETETTYRVTRVYGCRVNGRWARRGCAWFVRKGHVRQDYGIYSIHGYPEVRLRINGDDRGPIPYWYWNSSQW